MQRFILRSKLLAITGILVLVYGCAASDTSSDRENLLGDHSSLKELVAVDDSYLQQREQEVQDWVATCMREAGFDYVPWVPASAPITGDESDTPVVDQLERDASQTTIDDDPNTTISDNLPMSQQTLYFERLWGRESLDTGGPPSGDVDSVGCYNAAWVALYGQESVEARWTLGETSNEINQRITSDPAYVEQEQAWIECMASKGFEVSSGRSLNSFIRNEIMSSDSPSSLNDSDWEQLRAVERTIREANDACDDDLRAVKSQLRNSIEQEFFSDSPALQEYVRVIVDDLAARQNEAQGAK